MVPQHSMPTIKNRFPRGLDFFLISGLVLIFGCTPPGPRALLKGEKLIQEGKWEQAVLRLQEATQLLPNNAQAWNHLGIAYHGNNQVELALKCYRTALSLDRNLAATRYNLGCLLLEQNDLAGASEQLTSFTFLQSSSVRAGSNSAPPSSEARNSISRKKVLRRLLICTRMTRKP